MKPERPVDPGTRIGHMHLKVADLERALGFYRDVLGFEITQRMGTEAVFLSAGGYHHHIGLNTWESRAARRRRPERPGSTTSRSSTRARLRWPPSCADCAPRASRSTGPPTMG